MTLQALAALFRFEVSPLELVLRGTLVYWFLFGVFRFALRRDAGSIGIADILLLVLVADAAQNGMSGGYKTVSEAFVLIGTICGWSWLMDWSAYRFRLMRRFVEPPPRVLVRHGKLIARNLRRELVTVPELMARLREHGIDKLADVKFARIEPEGDISVIRRRDEGAADKLAAQRGGQG